MAYTTVVVLEHTDKMDGIASGDRNSIQNVANFLQAALAGTKRGVDIDIHPNDGEALAAATGSITCVSANIDASDTVTINGTNLTATQHHATGTVTIVIANTDINDTVTIAGEEFVAKAGESVGDGQFDISGDATAAATSLVACIEGNATVSALLTASSALGVVTLRAIDAGTGGNAITLVSSDADGLAVSGAGTLTNGAAVANNQFDYVGTNAQTATALAAAINASTTALISGLVTATASSNVVTVTANQQGRCGNAYTIASSDADGLVVAPGARLTGGTGGDVDAYNFTL